MRTPTMAFAVLALAGCANDAQSTTPYDEVAQTVGAQLATSGGGGELTALTDATMIAQGVLPPDFAVATSGVVYATHDGVGYQYQVRCFDSSSRLLATCGRETVTAHVTAVWGGVIHMPRFEAALFHEALWTLRGVDARESWVTGTSTSSYYTTFGPFTHDAIYYDVTTDKEIALIWDPSAMRVRAGTQSAAITAVVQQTDSQDRTSQLTGAIVFDHTDRATLTIDDRIYWIDRATGETTFATELE